MADRPWITAVSGGVEVSILAVPRSSRSRIANIHDGRLKVQLAAPPADGEANAALLELLVDLLGVKRSQVTLIDGHGHRQKRVRVEGLELSQVVLRLEPA